VHGHLDGLTSIGNTGNVPLQTLEHVQLLERAAPPRAKRICEVGFLVGHFAATVLSVIPGVGEYVYFDDVSYARDAIGPAADYLGKVFPGVRFVLHAGDSKETVPGYARSAAGAKCDVIHIDGDHSYPGARADYANFRALAHESTLFLFDDCGCPAEPVAEYCKGPTRVFNEAVAAGELSAVAYSDLALSYPHNALGGKGTCAAIFAAGRPPPRN